MTNDYHGLFLSELLLFTNKEAISVARIIDLLLDSLSS